jgi:hypothetical protein
MSLTFISDTHTLLRRLSNSDNDDDDETVILPDPNQINEQVSQY